MNVCSVCGFATAVVFKDINDDDIKYVEEYTRKNIPELLELNQCGSTPLNIHQLKIFFGAYAANPNLFEFTLGHRKLIKAVVKRLNDTITDAPDEQRGLAIWNQPTKGHWWKNLCATPMGLLYGDIGEFHENSIDSSRQPSKQQSKRSHSDVEQLKKSLFEKAIKVFNAYKGKVKEISDLSVESVSVEIVNGVTVKGTVVCNCCPITSLARNVKVFYQQTNRSGYWVPSNLDRHFLHHHLDTGKKRANFESDMANSDSSTDVKSVSLSLKIEPVDTYQSVEFDSSAIEDFLFLQMSKQNLQLVNQTLNNEEEIVDLFVDMDLESMMPSKYIKICKIDGDGSCLYGSLYHQMSCCSIGTANHKKQTRKLRQECVEHIKQNFDTYLPFLKSRVIEINGQENVNDSEMVIKCREFLETSLPLNTTFGGVETIKAVSEMKKVNIITITEDGSCNLVHLLDTSFERTVFVAYRNGNHYDSVAEMDGKTIAEFAKKIANEHTALSNGTKYTINID